MWFFSDFVFYGKFNEVTGKIETDKKKQVQYKQFHFANNDDCIHCNLKLICKGGCPMRRIWEQKGEMCLTTKLLVPRILKLFYEDGNYIKMFKNETGWIYC